MVKSNVGLFCGEYEINSNGCKAYLESNLLVIDNFITSGWKVDKLNERIIAMFHQIFRVLLWNSIVSGNSSSSYLKWTRGRRGNGRTSNDKFINFRTKGLWIHPRSQRDGVYLNSQFIPEEESWLKYRSDAKVFIRFRCCFLPQKILLLFFSSYQFKVQLPELLNRFSLNYKLFERLSLRRLSSAAASGCNILSFTW